MPQVRSSVALLAMLSSCLTPASAASNKYGVPVVTAPVNGGSGNGLATVFGDPVSGLSFGMKVDGVTNDTDAFQSAKASAPENSIVSLPHGDTEIQAFPSGVNDTLWQADGTTFNGGNAILGIGTDVVESMIEGSKWFTRSSTKPDGGPVIRVDQTVNHTGGTPGHVVATEEVNTTIPAEGLPLGDSVWALAVDVNSSAMTNTGVGHLGIAAYTNRVAGNATLWGGNLAVQDKTGLTSANTGPNFGAEVDNYGDDSDENGWRTGLYTAFGPQLGSASVAEFGVGDKVTAGGPLGNPTNTVVKSAFYAGGIQADTAFDASGVFRRAAPGTTPVVGAATTTTSVSCTAGSATVSTGSILNIKAGQWVWLPGCGSSRTLDGAVVPATLGSTIQSTSGSQLILNVPYPSTSQSSATQTVSWAPAPPATALRMAQGEEIDFGGVGNSVLSYSPSTGLQYSSAFAGSPKAVHMQLKDDNEVDFNGPLTTTGALSATGHLTLTGANPSIQACGNSPLLSLSATNAHGTVTPGIGATTCTIAFTNDNASFSTTPDCILTPWASSTAPFISSLSVTVLIVGFGSTGRFTYNCEQ